MDPSSITVLYSNGISRQFKLDWLLRRLRRVVRVEVDQPGQARLILQSGTSVEIKLMDDNSIWRFVHRPMLYGTPLYWYGEELTVEKGKKRYERE